MNEASRILVVDDDPAILQVFSQILRTAGYEVWEASTGRHGLQQTREHRPDLVLLDVVLPDMSGIEVCRQIKADAALPDIFVVLFSGQATDAAHKVIGLDTGSDDYITKPIIPVEFLARIRTILRLRRTTSALRVSEQRYRGLAESSPDAIFIVDRNTTLHYVNQAAMRWLGKSEPELLGRSQAELFPPEIARRQGENLKRAFERGELVHAEAWTPFPGGARWIETRLVPLRDQQGVVASVMGIARDVTERNWAENSLRIQRDFGVFLSSTNDLNAAVEKLLAIALQIEGIDCGGVYLVDPETGALNLTAYRGLSPGFVNGVSHFAPGSHQAGLARKHQATYWRRGEAMPDLGQLVKREGLLAVATVTINSGGQLQAVLNVGSHSVKDIPAESRQLAELIATQAGGALARIRAECSLEANRQLLEKTFQNLISAIFVVDADTTTIEDCNPSATQMFGYTRDEIIGQTPSLLHLNEARRNQFKAHLRSAVKSKGFLSEFEFPMRRKNGTSFPTAHNLMPVRNPAGRIVTWVSIIRDITERKRIEEELRQLPLRIIESQEAERLRVARELHDGVNQLIASAKMRLRKVEQSVPAIRPAAREILSRCSKLLVQALEENRRIAQNLRPSDLDELGLAAACRNFCRQFLARTGLAVKCSIARPGRRLSQAVELNLFRIVQEAMNNVEKHACATMVRVRLAFQHDFIILRIQDDGHGFPDRGSKPRKQRGHGGGLTNMRQRAASLGGSCEIKSAPTQGTTVIVRIPRRNATLTRI